MSSLYELKEDYKKLSDMLYEEDIDEQCILDTIESIEGEIEDKADNYAKLIKNLDSDANQVKIEKQRLDARQKMFENRAKSLKERLQIMMTETGKTKFKTPLFSFSIQKNGGLAPLWVTENTGEIPNKCLNVVVDNAKIREYLDTLPEGTRVSFAHLEERGESLRIK